LPKNRNFNFFSIIAKLLVCHRRNTLEDIANFCKNLTEGIEGYWQLFGNFCCRMSEIIDKPLGHFSDGIFSFSKMTNISQRVANTL
jgi:hypothetical protein